VSDQLHRELIEECERLSVVVSADKADVIINYVKLLMKWSAHINLVGTRDERDVISQHVVDCIAVLPCLPSDTLSLIDVGSGAGLPGALIAILQPTINVVGLEPIRKKLAFLNSLRRELPLPNFTAFPIRVEELVKSDDFTFFDAAISRATFPLPEWLLVGRALVRRGGVVLGMEGGKKQTLPLDAVRHNYFINGRARAVIVWQR